VIEELTEFFSKNTEDVADRLDANFYMPRYDEINSLISKSKFPLITLEANPEFLLNITSGTTPGTIRYKDEGIPFLWATDIDFDRITLDNVHWIERELHENQLKGSHIVKNDVLITMAGTIGRCAVYDQDEECNCNQAVAILRINSELVEPCYFAKYLNSRLGQLIFGKLQHVSSQPNINLNEIVTIQIVMPEKKKQNKIIENVTKIEAESHQLEKKAIVSAKNATGIISKKLNIDIPKTLEYFFKAGRQKDSEYFVEYEDNSIDRLGFYNSHPKHVLINQLKSKFKTLSLKEICREPIRRGVQPEYDVSGPLAIKTVNLKNYRIEYENALHILSEQFDSEIQRDPGIALQKNDILIAATGYVSMGKIDIFERIEPAIATIDLLILRIKPEYDPNFITFFLRSPLGQIQFEKWWSGSSGQIHIYEDELNQFIIPESSKEGIPKKEQTAIADEINKNLVEAQEFHELSKKKALEAEKIFERSIFNCSG
jgi:restriction endonuclease S subunit